MKQATHPEYAQGPVSILEYAQEPVSIPEYAQGPVSIPEYAPCYNTYLSSLTVSR